MTSQQGDRLRREIANIIRTRIAAGRQHMLWVILILAVIGGWPTWLHWLRAAWRGE